MTGDLKIRGDVFKGYFKFVKKKWGAIGLEQCRKDCGLDFEIDPKKYYDDDLIINLLKWIKERKGDEGIIEVGKFLMTNLGIVAWMARFTSPDKAIKKFANNVGEIFSKGRVEPDFVGPKECRARFYDIYKAPERCLVWKGLIEGMLQITKSTGTVEEVKCVGKGHEYCEYHIKWD